MHGSVLLQLIDMFTKRKNMSKISLPIVSDSRLVLFAVAGGLVAFAVALIPRNHGYPGHPRAVVLSLSIAGI
jgi:hypothetical protein